MDSNVYNGIDFEAARSLLFVREKILIAYLYGSILTDHFRPDSDVDIALFLKPGTEMTTMELLELAGDLSSILGYEVHLGVVSSKFLVFAKEVLSNGKPLFIKDNGYHDLHIATLLSMYAEYKERQKEVLCAYTC